MRTLTGTERTDVSAAAGHWVFAYLEVTDDTGTLYNLGALSVGASTLDFFNTATISENIDSNTLSFSATMKREIGTASLSPLRTDSVVNESGATPGTYSPKLDLHRQWRVMVAVVPRNVTPAVPGGYTELAAGVVDKITIDGLQDTITIEGRGMEADLLDAFVVQDPTLPGRNADGDRAYSGPMETVIQQALDDQMGVGVVDLYTPFSPSFVVNDAIGDINLQPALSDIAALTGWNLRYRYDASDVNRYTLFNPPRSTTTPDWTIDSTEYEDLTGEIDLSQVRNYIKVHYADATTGNQTVVAPGAESGPVSCTGGVATFISDQSAVLADGAIIVVDDVGYVVSAFNGSTQCTLAGAPDFTGKQWYTSASITRYGLRTMVIDLASGSQITDSNAARNLADAVLADLQDPLLVQTIKAPGLWFVQLHDYVQTSANGVHYNDDQFGGVTSYSHEFSDGMLTTTVGMAGSPKGRYTTWKRIGSGASASLVLPALAYFTPQFYETNGSTYGQIIYGLGYGNRCLSALVEYGTDPTFTTVTSIAYDEGTDNPVIGGFSISGVSQRDVTFFFRATPYSGPVVSSAVTGIAGDPITVQVYVPPYLQDTAQVTFDRSTSGLIVPDISGTTGPITTTLGAISTKEVFVNVVEDDQWLALSTIPVAEVEVGAEYRRQRSLVSAGSVRLNANIKTLTGTPTVKLKYTTNSFGAVADVMTWAPGGTGLVSSLWMPVPVGAQADVGLTLYVADGADTAALALYAFDAEFRGSAVVSGPQSASVSAAGRATVSAVVTRGAGSFNVDATPPALGGGTGCRLYCTRGYGLYTDSSGTTLATAAGQNIAYWKDYSGSGNHITAPTSPPRPPVSSNATLVYDGSDLYMTGAGGTFSSITDGEVFFLLKCAADPAVAGGGSWYISGNDNSSYPYFDGNIYEGTGTSGRYVHASPGGLTTWHVYSVRTSGTDWQSLKNNVAIDTRTGNSVSWGLGGFSLGKTAPGQLNFNGEIGAMVVYDGARTSGERASIVAALLAQSPP